MKIVLSGGGTLGPVVPLLAVREAVLEKYPEAKFIWAGTKHGPEREIVTGAGIPFFTIGAGKWRRYVSIYNIIDVFKLAIAFFQSVWFLKKEKPNLVITAGGFVSVPLHWAAALLKVPSWVHQQDVRVGLANKLLFPFAKKITTATAQTAEWLKARGADWIGNPCRNLSLPPNTPQSSLYELFNIPAGSEVIFALGGGTGSQNINTLMLSALTHLPNTWHIIHLVGKERPRALQQKATEVFSNYHVYEFFTTQMMAAYALAKVVVARAGFATLTELAALSKPAIIIPMAGTHQEDNARYLKDKQAIIMLDERVDDGLKVAQTIKQLIENYNEALQMGARLHNNLPPAKKEDIIRIVEQLILLEY